MKARILALALVAGTVAAPLHAANAGGLADALRNKLGQVEFVGKVVKGNFINAVRRILR